MNSRGKGLLLIVAGVVLVTGAALYLIRQTLFTEQQAEFIANSSFVTPLPELSELADSTDTTLSTASGYPTQFIYPSQIEIRDVGINVPIVVVGLNNDNYVTMPLTEAGFWQDSADLSAAGNVVIVGHNKSEPRPIFRDIGAVRPGMAIILTGSTGEEFSYVIDEIEIVQVTGAPVEQVSRVAELMTVTTTDPRLTLVACHPSESCDQRIVVISVPDE